MAESEETPAEELMNELTKRIIDNADLLQGCGKAFQVRSRGTLRFNIELGLRRNYADS